MKKTIISIAFVGIIAAGCDIDRQPYDKISSESMKTEANAITATYGNYALLKYSYIRWFEQLADFKSDDVLLNGKSVDTYFNIGTFTDSPSDNHVWGLWKQSYQVAYGTSAAISAIPDDTSSATLLHAKGENYFLRAYVHMNLIQIFANTWGLHKGSDPGVVIRTGPMMDTPVRSSVAEVLDFCEKDINRAISAMQAATDMNGGVEPKLLDDNAFADIDACLALKARLFLWEERWDDCIKICDDLLGSDPAAHLESGDSYEKIFQNARTDKEVIWCIGLVDTKDDYPGGYAMIGSMYNSQGAPGDGSGWAEVAWSQPMIDLMERYPQDRRHVMRTKKFSNPAKKMIYYPIPSDPGDPESFRENYIDRNPEYNSSTGTYFMSVYGDEDNHTHEVLTEMVNTYPRTYIMLDGIKQYVSVSDSMGCRTGTGGDMYPLNYMTKYSNQDGVPSNLASPVVLRYAEVLLNRAEAYAHKGNAGEALADVNIIRARAGLAGEAAMTTANMDSRGYAGPLDVVLDERRLELCFESFRMYDLRRNGRTLDRRYAGRHPWAVYASDDPRLIAWIPEDEIFASGIQQNRQE